MPIRHIENIVHNLPKFIKINEEPSKCNLYFFLSISYPEMTITLGIGKKLNESINLIIHEFINSFDRSAPSSSFFILMLPNLYVRDYIEAENTLLI